MMMAQRTVGDFLQLFAFQELDAANARRRAQMIHDRVSFVEAFSGDDVFVMNPLVLETWPRAVAMKPDVMLSRHLPEFLVIRHCRVLLQISPAFLFFL